MTGWASRYFRAGGARARRPFRFLRLRYLFGLTLAVGGASLAEPLAAPGSGIGFAPQRLQQADFSVLTYNVKGLPWPAATGREQALRQIGARLALMRREGRQPGIVVLQEAFTPEAKAIGDWAGYPYQVQGPFARGLSDEDGGAQRKWYRGETAGSWLDSGLVVLSDFPVISVERAPFPASACAGYDCLAAKGALMVVLIVPGRGTIAIATTHLNSRGASGAPREMTSLAYRRQTEFLAEFIARYRPHGSALVLAGDFNRGQRPGRAAALGRALTGLDGGAAPREALREMMAQDAEGLARSADAAWIRMRARDMQFAFDGTNARLEPVGAEIPFGTETNGSRLSDHLGFTIHYRFADWR